MLFHDKSKFIVLSFFTLGIVFFSMACQNIPLNNFPSNSATTTSTNSKYIFFVPLSGGQEKELQLNLVQKYEGTESKKINFKATKSPWIVNAKGWPTSQISNSFKFFVWKDSFGKGIGLERINTYPNKTAQIVGWDCTTVDNTGDYVLEVQCSGTHWYIYVGVE